MENVKERAKELSLLKKPADYEVKWNFKKRKPKRYWERRIRQKVDYAYLRLDEFRKLVKKAYKIANLEGFEQTKAVAPRLDEIPDFYKEKNLTFIERVVRGIYSALRDATGLQLRLAGELRKTPKGYLLWQDAVTTKYFNPFDTFKLVVIEFAGRYVDLRPFFQELDRQGYIYAVPLGWRYTFGRTWGFLLAKSYWPLFDQLRAAQEAIEILRAIDFDFDNIKSEGAYYTTYTVPSKKTFKKLKEFKEKLEEHLKDGEDSPKKAFGEGIDVVEKFIDAVSEAWSEQGPLHAFVNFAAKRGTVKFHISKDSINISSARRLAETLKAYHIELPADDKEWSEALPVSRKALLAQQILLLPLSVAAMLKEFSGEEYQLIDDLLSAPVIPGFGIRMAEMRARGAVQDYIEGMELPKKINEKDEMFGDFAFGVPVELEYRFWARAFRPYTFLQLDFKRMKIMYNYVQYFESSGYVFEYGRRSEMLVAASWGRRFVSEQYEKYIWRTYSSARWFTVYPVKSKLSPWPFMVEHDERAYPLTKAAVWLSQIPMNFTQVYHARTIFKKKYGYIPEWFNPSTLARIDKYEAAKQPDRTLKKMRESLKASAKVSAADVVGLAMSAALLERYVVPNSGWFERRAFYDIESRAQFTFYAEYHYRMAKGIFRKLLKKVDNVGQGVKLVEEKAKELIRRMYERKDRARPEDVPEKFVKTYMKLKRSERPPRAFIPESWFKYDPNKYSFEKWLRFVRRDLGLRRSLNRKRPTSKLPATYAWKELARLERMAMLI